MAHPQQALIDSLDNGDRVEVTWGSHTPRWSTTYMGPTLVETIRGNLADDDVITAVFRKERPPCPHRTLTMHAKGGYICTTHGFAECHETFDVARKDGPWLPPDDIDGTQLQEKVARTLAHLDGYDWDHMENRHLHTGWLKDAEVLIDLITSELGT